MLSADQFNEILLFKFEQEKNRQVLGDESLRTPIVYPPELGDLFRLYAYVIDNCVTSILEFGAGWSTLALSMGLQYNKELHSAEYPNYDRNPHPFSICSVDNSENFMEIALSRVELSARELVSPHLATPRMTWVGAHPVTTWTPIPRFDYDFIYLDAPEPEQVVGGLEFIQMQSVHDLPIAGDLVINEPYILPQTSIIIDGRTSNARYLTSNFYRNWQSITDFEGDFTLLHLMEPPLGVINQRHIEFRVERCATGILNYLRG